MKDLAQKGKSSNESPRAKRVGDFSLVRIMEQDGYPVDDASYDPKYEVEDRGGSFVDDSQSRALEPTAPILPGNTTRRRGGHRIPDDPHNGGTIRYELTEEATYYMYTALAQFYPCKSISDQIMARFQIEISPQAIRKRSKAAKARKIVKELRAEMENRLHHLPAAQKIHRLSVASRMIQMGLDGYHTEILDRSGDIVDIVKVDPYVAAKGIELAQKELGTDRDRNQNDAVKNLSMTSIMFVIENYAKLSDDDKRKQQSEWDAAFAIDQG